MSNETKGITVKIDAELHAEIRDYLEKNNMTMAEFITQAVENELHPKIQTREERNMENMRTVAFQVPESLFQRIKDYLHKTGMTQKEFILGLITDELDRNLEEEATDEAESEFEDPVEDVMPDEDETATVNDSGQVYEDSEDEESAEESCEEENEYEDSFSDYESENEDYENDSEDYFDDEEYQRASEGFDGDEIEAEDNGFVPQM